MSLKGDLGVLIVAYEFMRRGYDVSLHQGKLSKSSFREVQEYDLLIKHGRNSACKVEVKFIDTFYRGKKYQKHLRQHITEQELKNCDYVAILAYAKEGFKLYLVPKNKMKGLSYYKKGSGYTIALYNSSKSKRFHSFLLDLDKKNWNEYFK